MITADMFAEEQGLFQPAKAKRDIWHIARFWVTGGMGDDASLCGRWKADAEWRLDVRQPPTPDTICKVCASILDGTWKGGLDREARGVV